MEAFLTSAGIVALDEIGNKTCVIPFTHAATFYNPAPDLDRHLRHGTGESVACRHEEIPEANP